MYRTDSNTFLKLVFLYKLKWYQDHSEDGYEVGSGLSLISEEKKILGPQSLKDEVKYKNHSHIKITL
jgi:hypothetical protein